MTNHDHDTHDYECSCDHDCDCAEAAAEPPDPQLDPERSPGFDQVTSIEEIDVGRDVTLGEADPEELMVTDTAPVADASVRDLLADLESGSVSERQRAAIALADESQSEAILTSLTIAARTDEDEQVRQFAVEALADLGGEGAGGVASVLARNDEDPWVRAEAIAGLDRLDRSEFADAIEAAVEDEHHAVRRNALISLFKLRGPDALDPLLAHADDESERVREWVAHMLAGIDDDDARRALERLARTDDSEVVRITAKHGLSVDADRFRRQFTGALDPGEVTLPGESLLNRQPDL